MGIVAARFAQRKPAPRIAKKVEKMSAIKRRPLKDMRARKRFHYSGFGAFLFLVTLFLIVSAIIGSSILYYVLLKELPSIAALKDYRPSIATRVYADNDELIDEFSSKTERLSRSRRCPTSSFRPS